MRFMSADVSVCVGRHVSLSRLTQIELLQTLGSWFPPRATLLALILLSNPREIGIRWPQILVATLVKNQHRREENRMAVTVNPGEITRLLHAWNSGGSEAQDELWQLLYGE